MVARRPRSARDAAAPGGARAPWGTITRDLVVATAARMVRSGGHETMTIRSLAAELGVAPMTLYRHVRDKDDLLDEVVDLLLAEAWAPGPPGDDWRAWIEAAADSLRAFLVATPAALHVFLRHPVVSPAAVARMDAITAVLEAALGDTDRAIDAYGTIHTYTIGFAALEASRSRSSPDAGAGSELAVRLASFTTPAQFRSGLHLILRAVDDAA